MFDKYISSGQVYIQNPDGNFIPMGYVSEMGLSDPHPDVLDKPHSSPSTDQITFTMSFPEVIEHQEES